MGDDFFIIGFRRRCRRQKTGPFLAPGADDGGQACDEACRHGAVAIARLAAAEADERRPGLSVGLGQGDDSRSRYAGDSLHGFRRILGEDLNFQFVPAEDVCRQKGFIGQSIAVEDMHHAQDQGSIGPRADGDEMVG